MEQRARVQAHKELRHCGQQFQKSEPFAKFLFRDMMLPKIATAILSRTYSKKLEGR